jgi:hypothetical protein
MMIFFKGIVVLLFILLVLILAFIISNAVQCKYKKYSGGTEIINSISKDINTKYYYSIFNGDMGLVYDELKQQLAQYNFHEEPLTKHVHVSFGSLSGVDIYGNSNSKQQMINGRLQWWDPLFLQQKAVIKNTLGGHRALNEKIKLYETIKKLVPIGIKHIPKTYTITEFERTLLRDRSVKDLRDLGKGFTQNTPTNVLGKAYANGTYANGSDAYANGTYANGSDAYANGSDAYANGTYDNGSDAYDNGTYDNGTYILKKNKLNQQKGIRVFSDKKEYYEIKKELNINPHNAIIMEYITNPALTIDGKKFHLRMYVLLSIESGIKRCYIHDKYEILTAGEKYKKSDWLNKYIHISCGNTTENVYKFPDDIALKIDNNKLCDKI